MTDANNTGLRELANRYYLGELSFGAYRNERTRLLDHLTGQDCNEDAGEENTQPMPDKMTLRKTSTSRWLRSLWIVITILIMIAAVFLLINTS